MDQQSVKAKAEVVQLDDEIETNDTLNALAPWEFQICNSARTTHTVTSLTAGASYEFAVKAVTVAGESDLSPVSSVYHTGPRPPGPTGKPWLYGPSATAPHDPVIAFALPQDTGDAAIEYFRCIAFAEGEPEATTEIPLQVVGADNDVITAAAVGFKANRQCQFAVQAYNAGGWGPLGPSSPPVYVWRPVAPGRPCAMAVQGTALRLAWEAVVDQAGKLVTDYSVCVRHWSGDGNVSESVQNVRAATEENKPDEVSRSARVAAEVSGLKQGQQYSFRVQSAEGGEPRPASLESDVVQIPCSAPPPPGQPNGVFVETARNGVRSVRVEWTACDSVDQGSPVYGYKVHIYRLSNAMLEMYGTGLAELPLKAPWVVSSSIKGVAALPVDTDARKVQAVCGVGPGAPYVFEVQAINSHGTSSPSLRSDLVHVPIVAPSSCRGLVARTVAAGQVQLSWQPPAENGGSAITGYRVRTIKSIGDGEAQDETVSTDGQNLHWVRHVVAGLEQGGDYTLKVCAVNTIGTGAEVQLPWTASADE